MKVRDVIRLIEKHGRCLKRMRRSLRQFKHREKAGAVTIAGHMNDDVPPGALNSILKQAGLK